jgi:hypothetical protein
MARTPYLFILVALAVSAAARADAGADPGNMAPVEQYLPTSQAAEIALARSAGPAEIVDKAEIMVLGPHGYETAVKGTNGFVCYVGRSWENDFDRAQFWDPKQRAPVCFNPAAARSVLPNYLKRTQWVLSGLSRAEMVERTKAAIAAKQITVPEAGAMSFMLSKDGYIAAAGGHWYPHVMFWGPPVASSDWGANVPGSPVVGDPSDVMPYTMFFVPVRKWSDGSLAEFGH